MTTQSGKQMIGRAGPPRTRYALTDITTPGSGLFRLGDRKESRLEGTEVVVKHAKQEVTYATPYRLGADDWRVFLAIAALAGLDGVRFNKDSDAPALLPMLWDRFLAEGIAKQRDALHIRTTAYALLREIGRHDGGKDRRDLSDSLKRLSSVVQTIRQGNKVASGSRLLSFAHDEDSGELMVGISPQMARAILGESNQYVRISLVEVRRLDNAAAVLIQAYLSSRLRPGKTATYPIDTLVQVLYGKDSAAPAPATMRKRRQRVREALLTFAEFTTWQVSLQDDGRMATIHRVSREDMERWEKQYLADMRQETGTALTDDGDDPAMLEGSVEPNEPVDEEAP